MSEQDKSLFEKRAMILNLGAGNIENAAFYAKKMTVEDENPLSLLLLSLPHLKKNEVDQASDIINKMESGGMSDLIKPLVLNWLEVAKGKVPNVSGNVSAQETYHLILAADMQGNTDVLKKVESTGLAKEGISIQSLIQIADIFARHGLIGRALSIYQDIEAQIPHEKDIKHKISVLQEGGDIEESMLVASVKTPTEGIAQVALDMGMLVFHEQSYDSAKIFAHIAVYLAPDLDDASLLLAYVASEHGQHEKAISYFREIPNSDEDQYYKAQLQISSLQENAGDIKGAIETLVALAAIKDTTDIQIKIGDFTRQDSQYKRALKAYNQAFNMMESDGENVPWSLYYSRGIVYERLDDWENAEADLKKALKLEPNHPYILNYLGYSWADQGKYLDQALDMIVQAVSLRPDDGYIVDSLGWVYYKLGKFEKSIEPLEMAVELLPEDPTINDHLGDAYWQVGRKHEARFQWNRSLNFAEENPDNLLEVEVIELIETLKEKVKVGL